MNEGPTVRTCKIAPLYQLLELCTENIFVAVFEARTITGMPRHSAINTKWIKSETFWYVNRQIKSGNFVSILTRRRIYSSSLKTTVAANGLHIEKGDVEYIFNKIIVVNASDLAAQCKVDGWGGTGSQWPNSCVIGLNHGDSGPVGTDFDRSKGLHVFFQRLNCQSDFCTNGVSIFV